MPKTTKKEFLVQGGETKEEISNIWIKYIDSIVELTGNSKLIVKDFSTGKDNITPVTADTTLTFEEQGLVIASSTSTITINLPTTINNDNKTFNFTNNNSGVVVLDGFGSETIQGDATFSLYEDENLKLTSYQGEWLVS